MRRAHFSESSNHVVHWHIYQPIVQSLAPHLVSLGLTPNALCLVRIPIAMAIYFLSTSHSLGNNCFAVFLLLVCGVLDDADGYIARKYNQKSETGAFLDTAVDFFTLLVMLAIAYKKLGTRLMLCFIVPLILLILCYKRYEHHRETQGKALWPIPNALTHVFVSYAIFILLL